LTIRTAQPEDETAILNLLHHYCEEVNTPWSDDHLLAGLRPLLEQNNHGVVLVVEDPTVIAYSVLTWGWGIESGGQEALVDEMFVKREFRNQGIGERLLRKTLDQAKQQGVKVVFLETERENPRSRELYTRLGFTEESSVWMSIRL
jgi:ribosomal protein S18 acetylase RimI-like enzyme